jgi:hypothetical protein
MEKYKILRYAQNDKRDEKKILRLWLRMTSKKCRMMSKKWRKNWISLERP